ncbi:hypothetical protein GCM10009718_30260 [Isoptericola halotolerans]|uniref:Uncharacterized protein n=1 Tax=Isoptericola halotolerans TaxID=300560 RepID=A0ABX2A4K3_9MICO|nr:hypothetical protein [Isoptericola halotolerans]NOV97635.1 hypothetical protein [Isoptericola halotolerans]
MRLYVPATFDDLDALSVTSRGARWDVPARGAHAVTTALVETLPEEDVETHEYAAFLAAADASLVLVVGRGDAVPLRVVITVDVPDDAVTATGSRTVPSGVDVVAVPGTTVEAIHVDEPAAASDVRAALAAVDSADDAALEVLTERVGERDLLWYDATEVHEIPRSA